MAQRADWSPTKRSKIVLLSEQGCSYEEIRRKMGGNLTKGGISKFLKRYKETQSLENLTGKGRKRCTTASDDRRIKRLCLRDGRKSPGCIQDEMAQCNVKLSARTVRRRLQEFGLKSRIPRKKKPLLSLKERADIALIGLAVMGQNLILNMNDHGFVVCAFNRTVSKVDDFLANEAKGTKVIGAHTLEEMVSKLKKPRRVMLLVKAGSAVDDFINKLVPLLSRGDIIIDGGNSEYRDTTRRCKELKEKGILFVGSGVSGGEEGARYGPSLMPGGAKEAWPHIKTIFQSIAAKVGTGEPCCDWVGDEGAGHFVKMVHNGIEYGDMQLICEAYHLMKDVLAMDHDEMSKVFQEWNKTELDSFLIEITADILKFRDTDGKHLLPKIRDSAGQKGTGKWTAISALEYGVPVTLIGEAVFARCLSSLKDERMQASKLLSGPKAKAFSGNKAEFLEDIRKALYASKIISYAQGFMLLRQAAKEFGWTLNYGAIALMWRGGCIIRSVFLGKIKEAFDRTPDLQNLLLDVFFKTAVENCQDSWRRTISTGVQMGIPMPCFTTALAFYDGYRHGTLPANLIQAQRDYFGAHTYELLSKPGEFVHTNWTGHGGSVSSSSYNA
ncbi:6-phosphogluconate dehydrogenase, decarboxylating isoform X1 [Pantherophis guttatus]|uniref:6-phosphogluconate dehydrogenase, decarboxylating n=1 Tax=Pantherophis guttatus TaxID=94885 RepID=A0ABM3YQJ3_PANGU|nr:6-phosphogluconate dehydrogenase, decarboxylating isoform X1 [Pantherophis guttatus]